MVVESLDFILQRPSMQSKKLLFQYLFGLSTKKQFLDAFEDRPYANSLLTRARDSGYVMKNCKLYAYHFYKNHWARPSDFGVNMVDAAFLKRLDLEIDSSVPALTVRGYDRLVGKMLRSAHMHAYVGKLIYKKMAFLMKPSYGFSADDLRSMLIHKVVYALLKQYPMFYSPLHFQNTAKTVIHNTAMSFIKAQTRQKRISTIQNSDGTWSSLKAPLDLIQDVAAVPTIDPRKKELLQSLVQIADSFPPTVQRFLMCMGGVHDEEFSEFLGIDNAAAIESMKYEHYRSKLECHLGVTQEQTEALFNHVRAKLS